MGKIVNSKRGQTRSRKSVAGRKLEASGGRDGSRNGTGGGEVCCHAAVKFRAAGASIFQLDAGLLSGT